MLLLGPAPDVQRLVADHVAVGKQHKALPPGLTGWRGCCLLPLAFCSGSADRDSLQLLSNSVDGVLL